MTTNDTRTLDDLSPLRAQRSALIRAEVLAGSERAQLERFVRDSILKAGRDVNDVSEASGLTPREIRRLLDAPPELTDSQVAGI